MAILVFISMHVPLNGALEASLSEQIWKLLVKNVRNECSEKVRKFQLASTFGLAIRREKPEGASRAPRQEKR